MRSQYVFRVQLVVVLNLPMLQRKISLRPFSGAMKWLMPIHHVYVEKLGFPEKEFLTKARTLFLIIPVVDLISCAFRLWSLHRAYQRMAG
jgi:hypothetical protein